MPRLETRRLVLRPPEYSDASRLAEYLSDFDVVRHTSSIPHPFTEKDAFDFVTNAAARRAHGEGFLFSVLFKDDEALLGTCGLHLIDGTFSLGYWVARPYWGMGIATEAAEKVISFAFNSLKADRLTAGCFCDNPASARVLEKLGFVREGTNKVPSRARGNDLYDGYAHSLTRLQFGQKKAA